MYMQDAKFSEWINRLLEKSYMPKWGVFAIDIALVSISFFISTLVWQIVFNDFSLNSSFKWLAALYIVSFAFCILAFRTFTGIIRYSGSKDFTRLIVMVVASSVIVNLVAFNTRVLDSNFRVSTGIVEFWSASTFLTLFAFRTIVRVVYVRTHSSRCCQIRTIMLIGQDDNLDLAKLLPVDTSYYLPVGLLDLSGKLSGKRIANIPIIGYNHNIGEIARRFKANTLLILRNDIKRLGGLCDDCLANHIKMVVSEVNSYNGKIDLSSNVHNIQIDELLNRAVIKHENVLVDAFLSNRTILVTGGVGSIGSEIVRQLCRINCRIVVLDVAESCLHDFSLEIKEAFPHRKIDFVVGDVRNYSKLKRVLEQYRPDVVFHAAAYKHVPLMEDFPEEAILANVFGSKNVANLCLAFNVKKMVMVSTDKAVNPTNVMGASKRIAEQYINALFLKHRREGGLTQMVTTRFGNVLGSNGSVVPLFKKQIAKGGPITLTHKEIIRFFMTIPEACQLVLEAGAMSMGGEIFIFDMGKPVKIYDLAEKMIRLAGLIPHEDIKIVETGLRPGEKLYEELLTADENNHPTINNKIMMAKVSVMPFDKLEPMINNLIQEAISGNKMDVVRIMKEIVPEFISNNSCYECLDSKVEGVLNGRSTE
ncbi:nucleoside-diphosphate sugar epimerase/dehydratase [uncultured Acetobacteroides sp.]|uniref:polysaccharide biosynthesis protein n=1 Tax=uncultured Acetobacteroides sp. TaxID=1760811 RepID=UPI0029F53CA6|nr:nucleoside-diphosphate sugar epimerase/dehydratase [uncultured Acetobacteroides sp.]